DLRPQNGLSMIAGRLAGTDGLGPAGFTVPTLGRLMFGDSDRSAQIGLADVLAMCRAHPALTAGDGTAIDVRAACEALGRWDGRGGVDSHGQVLWSRFFRHLQQDFPPTWWRLPYDPQQPLTTPRGINGEDASVQTAFADAVQAMPAQGEPFDAAPGAAMRWDGVPLHGCAAEEGCFDAMYAGPASGGNGGVDSSHANIAAGGSFMMAVELTPAGPRASTMLTYSESTNPDSPHYTDQTALFSASQWVTERFSAADIAACPVLEVTRLRR
ncbi:MAG: penicillin acylase family protein, partial [Catenulispora sp.]